MPIGGQSRWLLTELPWRSIPGPEQILFRVRSSGYNLLLAHPERYSYIDFKAITSLANQGVKCSVSWGASQEVMVEERRSWRERWLTKGWFMSSQVTSIGPRMRMRGLETQSRKFGNATATKACNRP